MQVSFNGSTSEYDQSAGSDRRVTIDLDAEETRGQCGMTMGWRMPIFRIDIKDEWGRTIRFHGSITEDRHGKFQLEVTSVKSGAIRDVTKKIQGWWNKFGR